mmetsp:Transcript_59910/g.188123  ORF Transcript_59910/g.188123 Transcript_59910/m.188123 type:complete len:389 (-) Transcript_59910:38-1204(-)
MPSAVHWRPPRPSTPPPPLRRLRQLRCSSSRSSSSTSSPTGSPATHDARGQQAGAGCQLPQSVIAVLPASGSGSASIARMPLADFVAGLADGSPQGSPGAAARAADQETVVRLYTRRPRGRCEAISRALGVIGARVDGAALAAFPEMLPWWAVFDEAATLQPGLCATRARAVRYKLTPRGDAPVQPAVMSAVLAGGAVVRKGRVVLRGVRLMKALRLTRAATAGWASIGGFVGQAIAASVLDDGDTGTAVATAAGGWAGGLAGGGVAAAAASTLGVEALGAGSIAGGLVVCSSLSAAGAVAGAGLAYAAKKAIERRGGASDRTAEYHDCCLRLVGGAGDVFDLFDATLEFPPEDAGEGLAGAEAGERLAAAGWYAVRVAPGDQPDFDS